MPTSWGQILWSQFGASIDALKKAVEMCPDALWQQEKFWYLTYHTLFWLDCYLSETPEGFAPLEPFTLGEMDPSGVMPERAYTKDEMLDYLAHCRSKCEDVVSAINDEHAASPNGFDNPRLTVGEFHLHNMRHVQHGAAQLNLQLRQHINDAPSWVFKAED